MEHGTQELVTRAAMARRLHVGRNHLERVTGDPKFPAPVGLLAGAPIWRWSDVQAWADADAEAAHHDETEHLAEIRDRFRGAGFRLKIVAHPDGGWQALRIAIGGPTSSGQPFRGATQVEAAEAALAWLQTHH